MTPYGFAVFRNRREEFFETGCCRMAPNIKVSKSKKDIRCMFFLNDEIGQRHISGAKQCLNTVTEIGTVESRVFKIGGSVFWASHIKC